LRAEPLPLRGAYVLRGTVHADERGSFRRVMDLEILRTLEVDVDVAQVSIATNTRRGTLRGLHYQAEPHGEAKTLWCTAGAVFDVLVDLRPAEPTFGHLWSTTLTAGDPVAVHVPRGVAHGYQTLSDSTDLTYVISTPYDAASACGVNPLDPTLAIDWPLPVTSMSDRDRDAPPWPPSR
jgi:dTDP-4-dehydrorhamnose 3,5-epimerase